MVSVVIVLVGWVLEMVRRWGFGCLVVEVVLCRFIRRVDRGSVDMGVFW